MRGRKGHGEMNTPMAFFRLRGLALVAMAIATPINAAAVALEPGPAAGIGRLPLESPYVRGADAVEVLLPFDYDRGVHRRFRVLYVLPVAGAGGEHGNGLHNIRELGLHDRLQLICVQPLFER